MYKLLNNAVFGKTCENLLRRTEYQLVGSRKQALKYISKPTFKDYTVYNETLAGIHLDPSKVILNKPSYVGIAVLELSKTLMYDFYSACRRRGGVLKWPRFCFFFYFFLFFFGVASRRSAHG